MKAQLCVLSGMLVLLVVFVPFPDAERAIGPAAGAVHRAAVPLDRTSFTGPAPEGNSLAHQVPEAESIEQAATVSTEQEQEKTERFTGTGGMYPDPPDPMHLDLQSEMALMTSSRSHTSRSVQCSLSGKDCAYTTVVHANRRPDVQDIGMARFQRMVDAVRQSRRAKPGLSITGHYHPCFLKLPSPTPGPGAPSEGAVQPGFQGQGQSRVPELNPGAPYIPRSQDLPN